MTRTDTGDHWSSRAGHYATSSLHQDGPSLWRLLELARPTPPDRCLDIGTGAGHTAARMSSLATEVVGLDLSEGMLARAQATYGHLPGLRFVRAEASSTGFPSETFEIVTARHTLHHHLDLDATLRELERILKPGGRLVIADEVTPSPEVDAWYHALERARDPSHVRAYTLQQWRGALAGAGFDWVVGDQDTRYPIEVDAWIGRMGLDPEAETSIYRLFADADKATRQTFEIAFRDGKAVSFMMPVGVILAIKPRGGGRKP